MAVKGGHLKLTFEILPSAITQAFSISSVDKHSILQITTYEVGVKGRVPGCTNQYLLCPYSVVLYTLPYALLCSDFFF